MSSEWPLACAIRFLADAPRQANGRFASAWKEVDGERVSGTGDSAPACRAPDDLDAVVRFYRHGLGFEVIGSFTDHDGFDGVMLGHADAGWCRSRAKAMKILFLNGWRAAPGGVKPTLLTRRGHEVVTPKLPDDNFDEAVRVAQSEFDTHRSDVVVGLSRGGAVAVNIDTGNARLVLLCPGWKKWGTARTVKPGTIILHSRTDDVVPFAFSEELVANSGLPTTALIEVGSDHWLNDPESLAAMLTACERGTCSTTTK